MCGIVGILGSHEVAPLILEALKRLEYRGYDSAGIATLSDGLLRYYLSGTADAHLKGAPMKNVVEEMINFGAERELAVNFGGGLAPGDALEEFKRGFANLEEQWFTSEIVCDAEASEELAARLGDSRVPGFFPPYRA